MGTAALSKRHTVTGALPLQTMAMFVAVATLSKRRNERAEMRVFEVLDLGESQSKIRISSPVASSKIFVWGPYMCDK